MIKKEEKNETKKSSVSIACYGNGSVNAYRMWRGNTNTTGTNGAASTEGRLIRENTNDSSGVKEFTAFFAVPGSEINDDNEIEQKIAEIIGAKCRETWLTGQTAQEAVGTLIAGGEYPDMIDGGDGMKQLYDAGALVALDDYIDKYPNIKEFLTDEEWDKLRQDDGHIYWINQFGNIYGKKKQPPTVTRHSGSRREC